MAVSTKELIRRYQAGQTDLFEAIFERYKDYVYRIAYSLTKHAQESEEVVQDTFLDVLKALSRYDVDGPARFETWLYRVTSNRCKMRFRRKQLPTADWDDVGEQLVNLPDGRHDHDPERAVQQAEARRRLWLAVGQLKDIYREAIVLRYGQGLSYREIADACNVNIGTVKSRLNAAHRRLQSMMTNDDASGDRGDRRRGRPGLLWVICIQAWSALRMSLLPQGKAIMA
jgi:RNA polymerase sigma-70 factor (ECF subfamily)